MATVFTTNYLFAQRLKAIVPVFQVDSLGEQFTCAEYLIDE